MSLPNELLKTLEESPIPVATADLIAICATGKTFPRQRVWVELRKLVTAGMIRKIVSDNHCSGRGVKWVATKWDKT